MAYFPEVSGGGAALDVYRRNPNIAGRVIDGLAFVITPHDNKLQTLNQTATEIWRLAADGCTADAAASAIVELYEIDLATAERDTRTCCDDLVARGILIEDS